MKGQVVIIPFPFSDLSGSKRRPALVIADWGGDDLILCQITSKSKIDGIEIPLAENDFESGRLPVPSNIRPNKIFTADKKTIVGLAGQVSATKYDAVTDAISELIGRQ